MIKFTEKEKKVISEAVADSNNRNKFCPRWRSFFRLDRLHGVPLWQEMIIFVGLIFCILVLRECNNFSNVIKSKHHSNQPVKAKTHASMHRRPIFVGF